MVSSTSSFNGSFAGRLTQLFLLVLLLLSAGIISFTVLLYVQGYDNFCHLLLSKLGKLHKEAEFKAQFLTASKFSFIRLVMLTGSGLSLGVSIFAIRRRTKIRCLLHAAVQVLKDQYAFLLVQERFIRFCLFAVIALQVLLFSYCAYSFPISYDEAWTYLNFTSKSVFTSASYYPAPNNHIFFSILSNISSLLPVHDPKISMRLLNICCSVLCSFLFFKLMRRFYTRRIALYTLVLLTFSYPISLYSIQARGYELVLLFSLAATYAVIAHLSAPRKRYVWLYVISTILGFYTVPSFLYFFVSINLFVLLYAIITKRRMIFRSFVLFDSITAIITAILYAPVILISGLDAVTHNGYVKPIPLAEVMSRIPGHFSQSADWFFGVPMFGTCIFFVLWLMTLLITQKEKHPALKQFNLLALLLLIMPPFILLLHRVIPFERTWIYLAVPLAALIACLLKAVHDRFFGGRSLHRAVFGIITALTVVGMSSCFVRNYRADHQVDYQSAALFSGRPFINSIHSIASSEVLSSDLLTYEISRISTRQVSTVRIFENTPVSSDAIIFHNDSIRNIPNIGDFRLVAKNSFITFYIRK
jgi:hypothetical protein